MDTTYYIDLDGERLHYLLAGSGKKVLIAFHGYGLDAHIFTPIFEYLQTEFTILSFDLPHHGKSSWGAAPFTKQNLVTLVKSVIEKYNVEKISFIGYSLGGRVCLTATELMPEKIENVVLIAPDGLVFNMAYYFATSNFMGKRLFNKVVINPKGFFRFAHLLLKYKLIDASRHKFVTQYLETDSARAFLLKVWRCMAAIVPDQKKLKAIIKDHKIPVTIFMGKHDRIIPPSNAEKFKKGLNTVQLHILQKGHRILDSTTGLLIAESLL